jgi:PAS domain S-box-containing protein
VNNPPEPTVKGSSADEGGGPLPLKPIVRFTAALGTVLAIVVAVLRPETFFRTPIYLDIGLVLILWVTGFVKVSPAVEYTSLAAIFFMASLNSVLVVGFAPGVPVFLTLFILISTIYYGKKGGIISGAAALGLIAAGGYGWHTGLLPLGQGGATVRPSDMDYWIRSFITMAIDVFGIVGIVGYFESREKKVRARLGLAEEKFSKAFRISPDAMVIIDLETVRILEVNETNERLTGYPREEVVGKTIAELGTFLGEKELGALVSELNASGSLRKAQGRLRHRSGRDIDIVYSAERYVLEGRACAVAVIQDVTESKRIETALIQGEERLRSFVENATVGIYRSTPDGRIVMANRALIKIMGFNSFDELANRNLEQDGYEPSYPRSEFKARIERHGALNGWETAWKRKDGTTIYIRESANVIRDRDGSILYYDGVIEDISERKVAEQALRDSEERYRNLTAAAFEGVFITEEGRIVDVSDQGAKLLGYDRDELIGRRVIEFVGEDSKAIVEENIRNRREVLYRHTMVRKGGVVFDAEAQAKMMTIGGRTLRMTALRDVSERLQNERRQRNLEEQLRQTQKMEALGTLAGGIAHDFNNILTGILGNLQLTELELSPGHPATDAVVSSVQACRRARELVARILSFSRFEHENRTQAPLGPTLLEAVELLKVGLPSNIELRVEIDPACPRVLYDSSQIHQVVMNLGTNSVHAMRERGGTLFLALRAIRTTQAFRELNPQVTADHTVCLSLSDTGCGMDKQVLDHLFEPFFTTKTKGQGTGLGLAMVHAIMKGHGGAITVESTKGVGTCFYLYFPAAEERAPQPPPPAPSQRAEMFAPFGAGRRIMLVDDQDVVRNVGGVFLKRLGFAPMVFERPVDAIKAFEEAPDQVVLVISDLSMPEMTGLEMAEKMLAIRPGLPVLIASGHLPSETQQKADEVGVRGVISKPFELQDMIAHIRANVGP